MEFKIEMINATPKIDVRNGRAGGNSGCVANQRWGKEQNCKKTKKKKFDEEEGEPKIKNGKRIEMLIDFESVFARAEPTEASAVR